MSRSFLRSEVLPSTPAVTTRLGITGSANNYSAADIGKFVKQIGESAFGLCAAGDRIEAYITSVEAATAQGFSIGGVQQWDSRFVTFDGIQATPGTGTVTIGGYVVCGTVVARGTILPGPARVCLATSQALALFMWRVVSLGTAGTGAVDTVGLIERVC